MTGFPISHFDQFSMLMMQLTSLLLEMFLRWLMDRVFPDPMLELSTYDSPGCIKVFLCDINLWTRPLASGSTLTPEQLSSSTCIKLIEDVLIRSMTCPAQMFSPDYCYHEWYLQPEAIPPWPQPPPAAGIYNQILGEIKSTTNCKTLDINQTTGIDKTYTHFGIH